MHNGTTIDDVRRLAAIGEGKHIEFKRRVPDGRRLAKEISAFANTDGGHLLLGVTDAGEVVGLRDSIEEEFSLHQAVQTHCEPRVAHRIERVPLSRRRDVIVVTVPESGEKPHFVVDPTEPGRRAAYVRVRDMSIAASREAVRIMRSADRSSVLFEFGDKETKLMRYLEEFGRITVEQFARLADIPKKRASHTLVLLTRAGLLLLHADPRCDYFTSAGERAA